MADDPTIDWHQATFHGIEIDADKNAWHSGHVTEVVPLSDVPDAVIVATETGGAWVIVGSSNPIQLSDNWDTPDVSTLAIGPYGPRHIYAGTAARYGNDANRTTVAPILMETDISTAAPLFNWLPVTPGLPESAGLITRILILRSVGKIIVACAREQPGDTGGIWWSDIPTPRFSPGDPPRAPYAWKEAVIDGSRSPEGFWDLAGASVLRGIPLDQEEQLPALRVIAGGYRGGGLYAGGWVGADLVLRTVGVSFDDGSDATQIYYQNAGTTSVSSCSGIPSVLYASTAWPDGRLNAILRSRDAGQHWMFCKAKMANATGPLDLLVFRAGDLGADWANRISAHHGNPGMAAYGSQSGTFLTLDGGTEWRPIDGGPHTHSDVHALLFTKEKEDSIGFLHIGSDGGLVQVNLDEWFGLTDVPAFRSDYNRSLPTLQCYSYFYRQFTGTFGVSTGRPGLVATGLQDNGNVYCQLDPLEPWRHADGGDGGWNAFLADDTYIHNVMGEVVTSNTAAGVGAVIPVTLPAPGDAAGLKHYAGDTVVAPRFRNANGRLMLAVATTGTEIFGLFSDGAPAPSYGFERLGAVPAGQWATAVWSFQGDRIFVGTGDGHIHSLDTASGAISEQAIKLPRPSPSTRMAGGWVTRIAGFDDRSVFATLVGAVQTPIAPVKPPALPLLAPKIQSYVLAFDGSAWLTTASAGLPNAPGFGLLPLAVPHTRVERALLVSQDGGVWISRDDAATFSRASKGLPRRPHGADLRFAPGREGGTIYLSTYGRSVWRARV
jgi:hypothetical protein